MQRPTIHFAPEKNWMNDPNGTVYADGVYHLFYQYNPYGSDWGNICWAYATSSNLIDWERKGIRLAPDPAIGEKYCFSGCAVKQPDEFKVIYTSIGYEADAVQHHAKQIICDADAAFSEIRRNGHELCADAHGFPVSEWRDPFVFAFGGKTYMVLAGVSDRGHIFLYEAADGQLNDWRYKGVLFTPADENELPECPNVAVFGNKIVLFYSLAKESSVRYASGTFDGEAFLVRDEGYADRGLNCFYATNLTYGKGGDVVLFGWLRESLIGTSSPDGTYSGCLALPRILRLNGCRPEFHFVNGLLSLYKTEIPVRRENGMAICRSAAERTRITFGVAGDAAAEILKNAEECVRLEFCGDTLHILRHSLTANADERELTVPLGAGRHFVEIISDGTVTEMLVDNSPVSFRFYRRRPVEIAFCAEKGNFGDVCAAELGGAEIKG